MEFEEWLTDLSTELERVFKMEPGEGAEYIKQCGPESWREMFSDELTPEDAAGEEYYAAQTMGG